MDILFPVSLLFKGGRQIRFPIYPVQSPMATALGTMARSNLLVAYII